MRLGVVLLLVGFGLSWWWRSLPDALVLAGVGVVVLAAQWRFQVVSRVAHAVSVVLSHALAFLVQLVVVPGRSVSPPGFWLEPAAAWPQVSPSLWAPSPRRSRRSFRAGPWVLMVLVVVLADFAVGFVWARVSPPGVVASSERLESARADAPELALVQSDADGAALVLLGDGLWTMSPVDGEVFSFDPEFGRPVYRPAVPVARVAFVGGSSAFGLGQTDEGQLASEVSRQFEAAGFPVEVVNLGMPGFTTWQAAVDLERRLVSGERFDAVVAVTGWNDAVAGALGIAVPATLLDADILRALSGNPLLWWADRSAVARAVGYAPRVSTTPVRRYTSMGLAPGVTPSQAVQLATGNVAAGMGKLVELQKEYGFSLTVVWPPSWVESPGSFPVADGSLEDVAAASELFAVSRAAAAEALGSVPLVDVNAVVDMNDCFVDLVHTVDACSPRQAAVIVASVLDGVRP